MAQVPVTSLMSIDSCSVARIQDQAGNALVSPSLGPPFVVAGSSADALAGLINAAGEGTLLVELPTVVGTQWVAAQHVNTTMQQADGTVRLQLAGAQTVVVSGMALAAVQAALNACARCGGGGGGGGGALEWEPTPTSGNATGLAAPAFSAVFAPRNGSETEGVVTLLIAITGTATAAGEVNILVNLPLDSDTPTPGVAQGDPGGGMLGASIAASVDGANLNLVFAGLAATPFGVWTMVQYTTGAEEEGLVLALQAESESLTPEVTDDAAPFDALDAGPDLP